MRINVGSPFKIFLIYFIISALWILFSDQLVMATIDDPLLMTYSQSLKGWIFVLFSGLIVYSLVKKNNIRLEEIIQELRKSRDEFKATFDKAPLGIAHFRPNEEWIQVNQTMSDMLGYSKEELLKLKFKDFIHPDDLSKGRELDQELVEKKRLIVQNEKRYRRKDGSYFYGLVSKSIVSTDSEESDYLVVTLEDISNQKLAEAELRLLVETKNRLLAEVHHRVRNNLALISALFDLQSMHTEDAEIQFVLKDSQRRLKCLAMIHESFADSGKSSHIDFGNYLDQLVNFVQRSFNPESDLVIEKEIPPFSLNINQAVPAGLLCNELLMNCTFDAQGKADTPEIKISVEEQSSNLHIEITQNRGREDETHYTNQSDNLSHLIINTLVSQLQASFKTTENKNHILFTVDFKKRDLKGPSNALL